MLAHPQLIERPGQRGSADRLIAYERQAHTSRLRAEITRSRAEQSDYLKNVELARVLDKRKAKKEAAGGAATGEAKPSAGVSTGDKGEEPEAKRKKYRQREVVDQGKSLQGRGMDSVLGSVFG
jgi:ESF2/ABP1 family protein